MTQPLDDASDAQDELARIMDTMGIPIQEPELPLDANSDLVVLIPVDNRGDVCGNAIVARCREKSESEITVWCRASVRSRYALLEPLSDALNFNAVHIEVARQRPIGSQYEVSGQFVRLPVEGTEKP